MLNILFSKFEHMLEIYWKYTNTKKNSKFFFQGVITNKNSLKFDKITIFHGFFLDLTSIKTWDWLTNFLHANSYNDSLKWSVRPHEKLIFAISGGKNSQKFENITLKSVFLKILSFYQPYLTKACTLYLNLARIN